MSDTTQINSCGCAGGIGYMFKNIMLGEGVSELKIQSFTELWGDMPVFQAAKNDFTETGVYSLMGTQSAALKGSSYFKLIGAGDFASKNILYGSSAVLLEGGGEGIQYAFYTDEERKNQLEKYI